jgi:hypothetical protein
MTTLQEIRGVYERVVIDAAAPVPTYVENQSSVEFDEIDEYVLVRVNFGLMQELNIGCEATEFIRGSLVCEIYTPKGRGPGRGLEIAQPIIQALCTLNRPTAQSGQLIIARIGAIVGPRQTSPERRPHHFTGFSCPIRARAVLAPYSLPLISF